MALAIGDIGAVRATPQAHGISKSEFFAGLFLLAALIFSGFFLYSRIAAQATPGIASAATARASIATAAPTATPTPVPPKTYQIGDVVPIENAGQDWARITISDVAVAASYKSAYIEEKPQTAGNVFIAARVTYEALTDGVTYNPYDWQAFCAGTAISGFTLATYGPTPQLSSGTLPNGRKATGFVVYEVPAKGEVRMSYAGNMFSNSAPIFEVIIRAS